MASRKFLDSPDIKVEPDDLDTASSSSADSTQDNSVKSEQDWKTVPLSFPPQANVTYKDYNVEINGKKPRGVWDVIETEWFGEGVHRHRSNTTNMTAGTTPIDNHIPSVGRLRLPDELNDLNDNTSHENITEKGGNDDGGPIPVAMFVNTANSVNENRQHIVSADIPNQHLHTGDSLSLSQMATTNGDDNAYFPNAIADQGLEQDSFQQEEPMISTHPVKHEVNHKSDFSNEYTRPSLLNSHLVALAFMNNKHRVCTAQDVYEFISTHFPYYQRANNDHWKSTVRHTLSAKRLSYMFHKLGRLTPTNSMINTNRGNYWQINDVELNKIVKGLKNWRERFKDNYYTSVAYPDYIDGLIDMFDSSLVSFLPSTSPSILATKLLSPLTTLSSSSTTSSSTQSSSSSLPSTSSSSSGPTSKNAFKSTKDGSSIVRKDKHKHKTKTKKRLKRAGKKVKRVG